MSMKHGMKIKNTHWTVVDVLERHLVCQCVCGNSRGLRIAAVLDGTCASSCGCQPPVGRHAMELHLEAEQQKRCRDLKK
jgi:hypothetical protein